MNTLAPLSAEARNAMHYYAPEIDYFQTDPSHPAMQVAMRCGLRAGNAMQWATPYYHAAVLVGEGGFLLGEGSVAEAHAELGGCRRIKLGCSPGEGYHLCPGCQSVNHSEVRAIRHAIEQGSQHALQTATVYLIGHFWMCEPCCNSLVSAGVRRAVLATNSHILFNKEHSGSIIDPTDTRRLERWYLAQLQRAGA